MHNWKQKKLFHNKSNVYVIKLFKILESYHMSFEQQYHKTIKKEKVKDQVMNYSFSEEEDEQSKENSKNSKVFFSSISL